MDGLRFAYLANIIILVPVALPTLLGVGDTAQGRFAESAGYRQLVGALWTAILLCSLLGLCRPEAFAFVLLLQLIYKSLWLSCYAVPRFVAGRVHEIPPGIALSFLGIVALWPFLIPWRRLWGW